MSMFHLPYLTVWFHISADEEEENKETNEAHSVTVLYVAS